MKETIKSVFGNHLRLRVCGLYIEDDKLLLINHKGLTPSNNFWSPPGGGVNFNESIYSALKREFQEETGLSIEIDSFQYINEHINPPLHALELFFKVSVKDRSQKMTLGSDPELTTNQQILGEYRFFTIQEIQKMKNTEVHKSLHHLKSLNDLMTSYPNLHSFVDKFKQP